jgi:hypothetical protein
VPGPGRRGQRRATPSAELRARPRHGRDERRAGSRGERAGLPRTAWPRRGGAGSRATPNARHRSRAEEVGARAGGRAAPPAGTRARVGGRAPGREPHRTAGAMTTRLAASGHARQGAAPGRARRAAVSWGGARRAKGRGGRAGAGTPPWSVAPRAVASRGRDGEEEGGRGRGG